jgi:hypothetical protein
LNSSVCNPPCWEGITPGETTVYQISKDTVSPKSNLSFEGPLPFSDGSFYFDWKHIDHKTIYPAVRAITISDLDMTIGLLFFELGRPGSPVKVADVLSHFGYPDYIGMDTDMTSCRATMLYSDKRVWLRLGTINKSESYNIEKNTYLGRSFYLSDKERDEYLKSFFPKADQIQPWNGYGKYECKQGW